MNFGWLPALAIVVVGQIGPAGLAAQPVAQSPSVPEIHWRTDYGEARIAAERTGKMLVIFFEDVNNPRCREFTSVTLADQRVRRQAQGYVCVRLPVDYRLAIDGKQVVLLEHAAFREMLGRPGIAIVDLTCPASRLYGAVVSMFPLTEKFRYTPEQMLVILGLPTGTLTQRTLIYAVRTHPEKPASTEGQFFPCLAAEAEGHSDYQAKIRCQGHHFWDWRFHRINASLPSGCTAREVCAESWPGENLVEAAVECVRCWRTSSGHWSAVCAPHRCFAYDMKRGDNGIWYATGIFGG